MKRVSHHLVDDVNGASRQIDLMRRLFIKQPLGFFARRPVHPGKMLQNYFLDQSGLTQGELAQCLGISRRRVNELLNGRRGITADTALRLALYFKTYPSLWTDWQSRHDLYHAWQMVRSSALSSN